MMKRKFGMLGLLFLSLTFGACQDSNENEIIEPEPQPPVAMGKDTTLESPDGGLKVEISTEGNITYTVSHNGVTVVNASPVSMTLDDGQTWGKGSTFIGSTKESVNTTIDSPFYIRKSVNDIYNELTLHFSEEFRIVFRAYNEGMAYHFESERKKNFKVLSEEVDFSFPSSFTMTAALSPGATDTWQKNANNSYENFYQYDIKEISGGCQLAMLPLMVKCEGKILCIAEANVKNYPSMFIRKMPGNHLAGYQQERVRSAYRDGSYKWPSEWYKYIASCEGSMTFPWRILIVMDKESQLLDNDMIYKLAPTRSKLFDTSWIKPGMSTWDWMTAYSLDGVGTPGIHLENYIYHINFAKEMGIPYITIDAGSINMWENDFSYDSWLKDVIEQARKSNIGVWVWMEAAFFSDVLEKAGNSTFEYIFRRLSNDGIKGIKIDFFERSDQEYIDLQWKIAEMAAKYKLLLNLHSSPVPHGLHRAYPNILAYEAVKGQEHLKYEGGRNGDWITYDVTFPFLRGMAGPTDYTAGLMRNASHSKWTVNHDRPISKGTRCRQIADYIIFFSGLGTLADNITTYEKEKECARFLASIPTVWDETKVLTSKLGEYISIARQNGKDWFVGALNNRTDSRSLTLDLSFLDSGTYEAEIFKDGDNANTDATSYKRELITISDSRQLSIEMKNGGGFAARIYKK